jgi:hypothetical protein
MIDVNVLRGSSVRDNAGTHGEVLGLSLPWVRIGWWDEGAKAPREESFLRSDPRIAAIEILTLGQGWVPAAELFGVEESDEGPHGPSLTEDLEELLESPGGKKHSPFKTAAKIGPGPRHGWPHGGKWRMKHKKRDYWDCKCSNYKCKCKGKEGENKTVNINRGWKKTYNKLFKAYHKAKMDVAAPGRIAKRQAKAAKKK